jgi:cystathionine beta-lyase
MEQSRKGIVGCPNMLSNAAARAAFCFGEEWLNQLLVYLEGNRDYVINYLLEFIPEIKIFQPEGTYLAWLDCRELNLKPDPFYFFLKKARVALSDGKAFGEKCNGFARLNFGCPQSILKDALDRMSEAV